VLVSAACPPQLSGVSIILSSLVEALQELEWEINLHVPDYCSITDSTGVTVRRYRAVPILNYRSIRYPLFQCQQVDSSDLEGDIVHFLTVGPWERRILRRTMREGIPSIASYLTDIGSLASIITRNHLLQKALRGTWNRIESRCLGWVDAIHCLNSSTGSELEARYAKSAYVVRPGVNESAVQSALESPFSRDLLMSSSKGPILAFVGRLSPEKGPERALGIVRRDKSVCLLYVGTGPEEKALRSLVTELGLDNRVFFMGEVTHLDALRIMGAADVVLFPSRTEQFGLSALEAIAMGTPVVASSNLPGLIEMAREFPEKVHLVHRWSDPETDAIIRSVCIQERIPQDVSRLSWSSFALDLQAAYLREMSRKE
jgi:glycosyltransferase involved in cell wall biosynthesis